jgi:hypothetical protein
MEKAGESGVTEPSIARIRDYWLGGRHHGDMDRTFADHTAVCAPHIPYLVRAQRALLGRMVRHLVAHGVRQFLDLGSGVPTLDHVHEVAQAIEPTSRVIYVEIDPGLVDQGRELLAGNDNTAFLLADIREPDKVLAAPELGELFDLSEPTAVLMIETLLHIPDSDDPAAIVGAYMSAMCSGSYLALSHYSEDDDLREAFALFDRMNLGWRPVLSLRSRAELGCFFAGLELVEPGVVPVPLWRPDSDEEVGRNPDRVPMYAGLGRKP